MSTERLRYRSVIAGFVVAGLLGGGIAQAAGSTSTTRHPRVSSELTPSAQKYYELLWGVDKLGIKPVSSGAMLRFSYRVMDEHKAKVLNDKKAEPVLIDQKTGARLVVPKMEKIGSLRQSSTPEHGREYWVLFSNKGGLVKPGSRVDVVIGNFRASGMVVGPA
ncbi:MAG: hypothetical protein LAO51_01220 [Acidobacteriia bacterium]|nr:hypothetical protein [Terriglobia bacterium]